MAIKLKQLIRNLERVRDNPIKITEEQIIDIYGEVLKIITEKTIYDTGQARSVVIDEFAKMYGDEGIEYLFPKPINHWKNPFRGRFRGDSTIASDVQKNQLGVYLDFRDEALYAQENANKGYFNQKRYPSPEPERDNSAFETSHISETVDRFYDEERVRKKIRKLIKKIEGVILNG